MKAEGLGIELTEVLTTTLTTTINSAPLEREIDDRRLTLDEDILCPNQTNNAVRIFSQAFAFTPVIVLYNLFIV